VNNGTLAGTTDSLQGGITNNGTVTFDQSTDGTYAGVLSGTGGLEKNGNGTVTLSGTNTYAGGTTVNNGTLAGTTTSLQGGITNNGTVTFDQATDGTYFGNISGTGSLEKNGSGTVTLSGTNTYSGGTTVNNGTLAGTTDSLQGAITNNGTVRFDQSTDGTYAGIMSGSGSFEKNGSGTVTLSGTNTYAGGTTLNAGGMNVSGSLTSAVTINSGASLSGTGSVGAVTVNNGGRLISQASANGFVLGNTTIQGGGIFEWNVSNVSGFAGNDWSYINSNGSLNILADTSTPFVIEASTLNNSGFDPEAKKYEWNIASFSGGIQNFDRDAFSVDSTGMIGADGRFYVLEESNNLTLVYKTAAVWNSGTGNWSSAASWEDASLPEDTDNIEFVGAGGTSTNDDGYITTIDGLLFTSDVSGAYTLNGSALTISLEGIINESDEEHTIAMDLAFPTDQEINAANGALTLSGNISGAGALIKNGSETVTLSGTNTYSGGTTVNNGTLVGTTDSLQGGITNNGTVRFDQSTNGTYADALSGSGSLEKNGTGTVTLSGTNSYSGGTSVNNGTLEVASGNALGNGSLTLNGGELLVQSSGEMLANLGFGGNLTWNDGTIAFYDTGDSPEANDLKISVGGNVLNGGSGGQFDFSQVEALDSGTYTLLAYSGTTDFQVANFAASAGVGTTLNGTFSIENGSVLYTVAGATSTGTDIENNGGANTPVVSDYTINQSVITRDQENTVNSLIFEDDGKLAVEAGGKLEISSGKLTVSEGSNSTVSGGMLTASSTDLVKDGAGQLNLENEVDVTNDAKVEDGLLAIKGDGILKAKNLIVQSGGTLGGDGTAQADVQVFGTLATGNSPGTLNITGDLTLDAGSTTEIEIESLSNYDQTIATGNISLNGTLTATNWGNGSIQVGDKYDVFQSTGGTITGEFDTYNAPTNLRIRLLNDGSVASLRFAPETYTLMAQTQNQFNVAKALDSFIPATSGDTMTVSTALDELTAAEYPAAFHQVMPYFHESISDILLDQSFHQTERTQQRLSMNRARGLGATGSGWRTWAQVNFDSMTASAFDATPGYDNERDGFQVGADFTASSDFQFGFFAGRDQNKVDYSPGSSLRTESMQFGAYASLSDSSSGFYIDAILTSGFVDLDTRRSISFTTIDRSAAGETDSAQFSAALSVGRDFKFGNFTFGPHAGFELSHLNIDGFAESGADSLNLGLEDQTVKSLTSEIGGHLSYRMQLTESLTLVPELRVSLNNELTDSGRTIQASLEGGEGAAFDYVPVGRDRNGVSTSLGFSALRGDDWSASVHWNTNSIERDAKSDSISISLNRKF
jgi:autotransporter-associated beta strand protein